MNGFLWNHLTQKVSIVILKSENYKWLKSPIRMIEIDEVNCPVLVVQLYFLLEPLKQTIHLVRSLGHNSTPQINFFLFTKWGFRPHHVWRRHGPKVQLVNKTYICLCFNGCVDPFLEMFIFPPPDPGHSYFFECGCFFLFCWVKNETQFSVYIVNAVSSQPIRSRTSALCASKGYLLSKVTWPRSKRASAWITVILPLVLNTYELFRAKVGPQQSVCISTCLCTGSAWCWQKTLSIGLPGEDSLRELKNLIKSWLYFM